MAMSKETETNEVFNHSKNKPLSSIIEHRISRRSVLQGSLNVAATTVLGGFGSTAMARGRSHWGFGHEYPQPLVLGFESIQGSRTDAVVVPEGYEAQVLVPWGTPLNDSAVEWQENLQMTPEQQLNSVGMHHDGMYHFPLSDETASEEFLLTVNHEYIDQTALWKPQGGPTNAKAGARPADEVRTEINAHGVSVIQVRKQSDGSWTHVKNSPYNRRITSATPMQLSGPVAGTDYVKTAYSVDGTQTRGTNNNCACGFTPWGTYLTCEENWPGYFCKSANLDDARLGVSQERGRYGWETATDGEVDGEFQRFDATPSGVSPTDDYRNEPRTFGYVVEIDPYTNTAAVKRTHLGRFRHEGCWLGKLIPGEPVVYYSGHDAVSEYIYKFVSDALWDPRDANRPGDEYDRLAIGNKYLDTGTLYVARFNDDGSGEWLPLTPDAITKDGQRLADALGLAEDDLAGIIINTCDAADLMGATPMDRPEWGTVDPQSGEVYMTLTNNWRRQDAYSYTNGGNDIDELGVGYDTVPTNSANPRQFPDNEAGHIIRWRDFAFGTAFVWEIFVFGAGAADSSNPSGLTELNQFGNPDGLWYDDRGYGQGILWIETDNGYDPVENYTNDQVLAVVPATLGFNRYHADAVANPMHWGSGPEHHHRFDRGDDVRDVSKREHFERAAFGFSRRVHQEESVINPSNQAQLKRFAVGPNGCEVTGIFAPPDKTALFINIQHPGNWPSGTDATAVTSGEIRPRASTVVIRKIDGGKVGE
jgi:secreted PhoX family phosphatase